MRDIDYFLNMLGSRVEYKVDENTDYYEKYFKDPITSIQVENSMIQGHSFGYNSFCSVWVFDKDGKFLAVGHYE